MLKYVRLVHAESGDTFVFGLAPITHAQLAEAHRATGWTPHSAGFVSFGPACGVTTHGDSVSLRLAPDPHDAAIIAAYYRATGDQVRGDQSNHSALAGA